MIRSTADKPKPRSRQGAASAAKRRKEPEAETLELVAYDENLLERFRTLWQLGDWPVLAQTERTAVQHHPDRPRIALLVSAAHAQLGQTDTARNWLRLAQDWGCPRSLIARVLLSGAHNTLGRASVLAGLPADHALNHFRTALETGMPGVESELLLRTRIQSQLENFPAAVLPRMAGNFVAVLPCAANTAARGLHALAAELQQAGCLDEADGVLARIIQSEPGNLEVLQAYAELAMQREDYVAAISRWQALAAMQGEQTPRELYDQLGRAYAGIKGYPQGEQQAEESLRGDEDKHRLLGRIHARLAPRHYLEIGVQSGKSLALANCPAIGIDPMPQLKFALPATAQIFECGSDEFFTRYAQQALQSPPDLVFIDGMHLFEFALRDFINVEKHAHPGTLVVIDDILPGHPAQVERNRRTRAWTGDVWKLHAVLQAERPDLQLLCLDAHPTGLLLIAGLDPANTHLQQHYSRIVADFDIHAPAPENVISRQGVKSCQTSLLPAWLDCLQAARADDSPSDVRAKLHACTQAEPEPKEHIA